MTSVNEERITDSIRRTGNFEKTAWKWMRYSGILVIPLVFIHILIQDVVVGVHEIDLQYVDARWQLLGWRIYDGFLLAFAFLHGMNGLRQVLLDFAKQERLKRLINISLFILWLIISIFGFTALIAGVRT